MVRAMGGQNRGHERGRAGKALGERGTPVSDSATTECSALCVEVRFTAAASLISDCAALDTASVEDLLSASGMRVLLVSEADGTAWFWEYSGFPEQRASSTGAWVCSTVAASTRGLGRTSGMSDGAPAG